MLTPSMASTRLATRTRIASSTSCERWASVVSFMKMRGSAPMSSVMYRRPSPLSAIIDRRLRSAPATPTADTVMRAERMSCTSSTMPS